VMGVGVVSALTSGTISVNTPGTITSGTVSVNTPGTITSGSIAVTAGTVGGKAASGAAAVANPVQIAGTDAGGTIYSPIVTTGGAFGSIVGVGVLTTVTNLSNGTIQNSGTTTGVGVVTTLTNLSNGTIQNSGTTTGVGVVTTVTNLSNGTIQNSGTTTGVGVVSALTSGTVSVNTPGTITSGSIAITAGTIGAGTINTLGTITNLANGTIQNSGTTTGVGTVSGIGVVTNITQGSITVTTGTIVGNVASGTTDSGNPVKVGGKYNLTLPTLVDGYRGDLQQDGNGLLKTREGYGPGYEDNVNAVAGILQKPVSSSTYTPSEHTNFGAVTGTVVKTSAGNVYSFDVTSTETAICYFQLHNGTASPALGGTPVASYPMGSAVAGSVVRLTLGVDHFTPSRYLSTGIAYAFSSTNGTLGTASITVANHNVHIKYV